MPQRPRAAPLRGSWWAAPIGLLTLGLSMETAFAAPPTSSVPHAVTTVVAAVQNAIQAENALPGDPSWNDFWSVPQPDAISGYGSRISVNRGDSLDLFVTTVDQTVSIDIFRTGWYEGAGARMILSLGSFPGLHQAVPPPDPVTGMVACQWTRTAGITIPANWTTGVYLARLTGSPSGNRSFIFFVVRNDGGHEAIAFQTSVTTYQAYNVWGGLSLYENHTDKTVYGYPHAMKVSFDRPFDPVDWNGAGQFLYAEYPFVRWLEANGYDVTYLTDIDTHTNVNPLVNHRAFLSVGHDEYWSKGMRDNVEGAIAAGVNVAFFSANSAFWQIRFEPNDAGSPNRVQVSYKEFAAIPYPPGPDPMWNVDNSLLTDLWRNNPPGRPENGLLGVMYNGQVKTDYPFVVVNSSNWVYAGTGLTDGTSIPGIVGYEYDRIFDNGFTPPGFTKLSQTPIDINTEGVSDTANAGIYTAAGGARIFASGTIQWSYGLDSYSMDAMASYVDPRIQRITANILADFASAPIPESLLTLARLAAPANAIQVPASARLARLGA